MDPSTKIGVGIILLILLGGFWFTSDNSPTGNVIGGDVAGSMRHIVVDATWFEFNPNEIRVKQGEDIMIMINNIDVDHGITIPALGVRGNNVVTFTADKKGEFDFYCDNFCGTGHRDMVGKIIVE